MWNPRDLQEDARFVKDLLNEIFILFFAPLNKKDLQKIGGKISIGTMQVTSIIQTDEIQ